MTFCKSSTAFLTSEKANYNCCAKHGIWTRSIFSSLYFFPFKCTVLKYVLLHFVCDLCIVHVTLQLIKFRTTTAFLNIDHGTRFQMLHDINKFLYSNCLVHLCYHTLSYFTAVCINNFGPAGQQVNGYCIQNKLVCFLLGCTSELDCDVLKNAVCFYEVLFHMLQWIKSRDSEWKIRDTYRAQILSSKAPRCIYWNFYNFNRKSKIIHYHFPKCEIRHKCNKFRVLIQSGKSISDTLLLQQFWNHIS